MSDERTRTGSSGGRFIARTPRWVVVSGAALLVVLIVVLLMLLLGGDHGAGRHM